MDSEIQGRGNFQAQFSSCSAPDGPGADLPQDPDTGSGGYSYRCCLIRKTAWPEVPPSIPRCKIPTNRLPEDNWTPPNEGCDPNASKTSRSQKAKKKRQGLRPRETPAVLQVGLQGQDLCWRQQCRGKREMPSGGCAQPAAVRPCFLSALLSSGYVTEYLRFEQIHSWNTNMSITDVCESEEGAHQIPTVRNLRGPRTSPWVEPTERLGHGRHSEGHSTGDAAPAPPPEHGSQAAPCAVHVFSRFRTDQSCLRPGACHPLLEMQHTPQLLPKSPVGKARAVPSPSLPCRCGKTQDPAGTFGDFTHTAPPPHCWPQLPHLQTFHKLSGVPKGPLPHGSQSTTCFCQVPHECSA